MRPCAVAVRVAFFGTIRGMQTVSIDSNDFGEIRREGEEVQLSLFSEDEGKEKARRVDRAVDEIRNRFGYHTIGRASCGSGDGVGKKHRAKLEAERKK